MQISPPSVCIRFEHEKAEEQGIIEEYLEFLEMVRKVIAVDR